MLGVVARSNENTHEIQNKRCNEKCLSTVPNFGSRFTCMSQIGCGTFGEVWRAFDNDHQNWVAVKTFQEVCSDHLGVNMMVIREISLLRKLSHPNITKTLDVLMGERISSESLLLVMELEDMDLHSYQRKFQKELNLSTVQFIIHQIIEGCSYLHSNFVMHRDLKPDNILICSTTRVVKVADFGYARTFTRANGTNLCSVRYSWPIQAPSYKAPEVLLGCECYSHAVDVWSVGCIFGELLCGGRKLFAANSVNANSPGEVKRLQMDSEAANEHRVGDVRMWEEQTNHTKSVVHSSASLNSCSKGRMKTETLVESLKAIFELLGPLSDTNAPDLRALSNYKLFTSFSEEVVAGERVPSLECLYSVPGVTDMLLKVMEPRMRCRSAADLLRQLLTVDPCARPTFLTVSGFDFILTNDFGVMSDA